MSALTLSRHPRIARRRTVTSSRCPWLLTLALLLPACGDDPAPAPEIPSWAKVAPEQIAEAKKHGVPVAFENDIGMRFVLIPEGTFLMGSPGEEVLRVDDETQREMTISRPFFMQITEVTNAQFRRFNPHHPNSMWGDFNLSEAEQPVVEVNLKDAMRFAARLSRLDTERDYRIPSECEWEYACRGGTVTRYWSGDTVESVAKVGNLSDARDPVLGQNPEVDDGSPVATTVASYRPNPWGLHDMHGNVWEICREVPYPSPDAATRGSPAPLGAPKGQVVPEEKRTSTCVVRGGAWLWDADTMRSACRMVVSSEKKRLVNGFRLVSPLPEPGE